MNELWTEVTENLVFVLQFLGIIAALFVVAMILERAAQAKRKEKEPLLNTRKVVVIGMFSAMAAVLMLFEIPVFFAPNFYKLDFSELPILIGSFAFGPVAGVMMEFVKILLNLLMDGTSTAFVGEFANFAVGCSFILPASAVYAFCKNKKGAIAACVIGTLIMTIFGTAFNAVYLLPAFSELFHMPLEQILAMGVEENSLVQENSIISFVAACVAPLNLIKGIASSVVTLLIYKPLSPIIKSANKK